MHVAKRKDIGTGRGTRNKTAVVGVLEHGGSVQANVVEDIKRTTLDGQVRSRVKDGASVYTDNYGSYVGLDRIYDHRVVDHGVAYVDGRVHTNGLENFWSLLKRGLHGTYVSVDPGHLFRYLDECVFTYNQRGLDDLGRFRLLLSAVAGRRLTYAELTGSR
jgi:transposase-like protein